MLCNFIVPQMMWFKRLRAAISALFIVVMFVNVGMWLERFVIIVTSLHRDFLPSSWEMYHPTIWDFATFFGTIGLVHHADVPVRARAADDFDLRDADAAARQRRRSRAGRGGGALMSHDRFTSRRVSTA